MSRYMIQEIEKLISQYWHWLKDRTTLREIDGVVEISSPFIDRHNDHV
jgi:hypothetical protein